MRFRSHLLVLALLPLVIAGCRQEQPVQEASGGANGGGQIRIAPDFTLETPDGESFTLSDHRGQIVVINFWATWCAPCVVEVPELMELHEEYADRGVFVVGVSQDTGPSAHIDVRDFQEMFDVNYPMVIDPGLRVGQAYGGVDALPTTFIVDQEGAIHHRRIGLVNKEDVLRMLSALLPNERAAVPAPMEVQDHPVADAGTLPPERPPLALGPEAVADLIDDGAMVIDLRPDDERMATGGIPYSLALTLDTLDRTTLPANLAAPIVFVATDEEVSWQAASRASGWGYRRAHPLAGGFASYIDAGLPIEAAEILSEVGEFEADEDTTGGSNDEYESPAR